MENVKDIQTGFIIDSPYLRTRRIKYTQNGRKKFWDFLETHDSVVVMLFNVTRNVMVFVRMFRPAVYFCSLAPSDQTKTAIDLEKYKPSLGFTMEPCSGIVELDKPKVVTAIEEVYAHTGYRISLHDLELISTFRKGVGVTGSKRTTYFCEVTDALRVGKGGGVDDKISEYFEMTIPEIEKFVTSTGPHNCSPTCLFGIMWFLHCKAQKYQQSSSSDDKSAGKSS